jgi:hypothetical protein
MEMLKRVGSLLQDVDATAGLTLKVKQEPFTASGGLIHGKCRPFVFLEGGRGFWVAPEIEDNSCMCIVGRVTHII